MLTKATLIKSAGLGNYGNGIIPNLNRVKPKKEGEEEKKEEIINVLNNIRLIKENLDID